MATIRRSLIAAALLAVAVEPSWALNVTRARLKNGSFHIIGRGAAPVAALSWEGTPVGTAAQNGTFSFETTIVPMLLPPACLAGGKLSDGVTTIDVLVRLCDQRNAAQG